MLLLIFSLAALAVSTLVGASGEAMGSLPVRGEGFLRLEVTAREVLPDSQTSKRQQSVGLSTKGGIFYFIFLYIGTPAQTVAVIIDTGSSDMWVNPNCATSGDPEACAGNGHFDYRTSSTVQLTGSQKKLSFFQGQVLIEWAYDTVAIGCSSGSSAGCSATTGTVTNQYFGLGVDSSSLPNGALGLSPPLYGPQEYPYFLDNMVSQKLIASRAFSLDLRLESSVTGSVIFGGVDTGKFIGALQKCPMLDPSQTPDKTNRYWIMMNGIGITTPQGLSQSTTGLSVPMFVDSGTSYTFLPQDIYWAVGQAFPTAKYDPGTNFFVVDCSVINQPGTVDFFFGSKVISVAYSEFVVDLGKGTQQGPCILGMRPATGVPILGDTFLRAAYVVYDQDNKNLHLAQAADCGSNIITIGTGPDAVPSSTGMCPSTTTTATSTASLDVSAAVSPTSLYSGGAVPTSELNGPGPQTAATSVPGSTMPTVCTTCSLTITAPVGNVTGRPTLTATTTTSGAAKLIKAGGSGALAAMAFAVMVAAWM